MGNQILREPIFSIFRVSFFLASVTLISEKSMIMLLGPPWWKLSWDSKKGKKIRSKLQQNKKEYSTIKGTKTG